MELVFSVKPVDLPGSNGEHRADGKGTPVPAEPPSGEPVLPPGGSPSPRIRKPVVELPPPPAAIEDTPATPSIPEAPLPGPATEPAPSENETPSRLTVGPSTPLPSEVFQPRQEPAPAGTAAPPPGTAAPPPGTGAPPPSVFVAGRKGHPPDGGTGNASAVDTKKLREDIERDVRAALERDIRKPMHIAEAMAGETAALREDLARQGKLIRYFLLRDRFQSMQGTYFAWMLRYQEYAISALNGKPVASHLLETARTHITKLEGQVPLLQKQVAEAYHQLETNGVIGEPPPTSRRTQREPFTSAASPP